MTHHGELQLANYSIFALDSEAKRSALNLAFTLPKPALFVRSGFAQFNAQPVGMVMLPLDHAKWRGLITVQVFEQKILEQFSHRHRSVEQLQIVKAARASAHLRRSPPSLALEIATALAKTLPIKSAARYSSCCWRCPVGMALLYVDEARDAAFGQSQKTHSIGRGTGG